MGRKNNHAAYLFVAGVAAIVAIVALVLNGASLEGAVSYQLCTDDDPTDDIYKAGTITVNNNQVYEDTCVGDNLIQQYCHTGRDVKQRRAFLCENGCLNGACRVSELR